LNRARLTSWAVAFLLAPSLAAAHVPQLRGRLIDLVGRSDAIVIGTVETTAPADGRLHLTTVRVDETLSGDPTRTSLRFRSRPRFAAGRRYVFFLGGAGESLECLQESGTVFPVDAGADAAYRQTIVAIRRAGVADEAERIRLLRAALIPALSAPAPELRYYAVLDLTALSHHDLSESERRSLERLVADSTTDPAVRPVVATLLRTQN
jgi:hypothetical protein